MDSTAALRVLMGEGPVEAVVNECSNLSLLEPTSEDDEVEGEAERESMRGGECTKPGGMEDSIQLSTLLRW